MTNNEKKFWDILNNLFVGAEVKGKSGFINLMIAKQTYFKKVKEDLLKQINEFCKDKDNENFKDELYDKLYSFFHRYFSQSGSIYYNYTPLFYNIYTKAYGESSNQVKTFFSDYERVISNKQDTSLFYKTQMLYYVKSDKIFKDLEIEIEDKKYIFDASNMEGKRANEKRNLVYELKQIEDKTLSFNVAYSENGKITKIADIIKEAKRSDVELNEEELKKAFSVFERQSNIDYFINKDAKKFLSEQLDMWIYQYMFSQEVDFNIQRFNQIQGFKKIALKLINFISQFENELVKIWNKPRFVLNSNIVVTIDRLRAKGFDIDKLKNHQNFKEQEKEWQELGIVQSSSLLENEFLPIDTKYFSEFKDEIESLFEPDEFDGLLIKSENYQALNSILPRFKDRVDLIYIDPPFNTGDDFAYIDRFQDSTWLSLMENRLELAKELLSKKGSFYLHLDNNANYMGRMLLNKIFGKENFRNEIVWHFRTYQGQVKSYYPRKHNTILWYSKIQNSKTYFEIGYSSNYQITVDYERWKTFLVNNNEIRYPNYPKTDSRFDGYLKRYLKTVNYKPKDGDLIMQVNGYVLDDVWVDIQAIDPKNLEERIQSEENLTQKPEALLLRIIKASSDKNSIVLDYHLGSGTTVATAQKLGRKYIGIEMGEHFYSVIIPRMKKVLSGFECGISKEVEYKGGGIFKYYELEQYEQILRSTKYKDTPNDYLDSKDSGDINDCFLFDEKLSDVIICENDSFKVDLSKLYPDIDLKETIHNITGKRPKEITDTKVIFEDKEYELLEILKPLLLW
ncbi:site-specific DNA-methyltransferase [Campylobacter sp. faydin G-140]|uniref:site-specific DNA-methyltransferase n=1 Tax=Campylobacter anatolicus TaxID=2829105 RepID=UPI001B903DD5|nr:site-specific DNA-methyltransferase [Campylobacter anatolicus]MBR8465142.1 site-specific DNA-methyltransferase [Campylobacter anatolicus]